MPGYLNRVINADKGTKHVQRTIIKNNGKNNGKNSFARFV